MKTIPLTRGYSAIVDKEDYKKLAQHKWCVLIPRSGKPYAYRQGYKSTVGQIPMYMARIIAKAKKREVIHFKNGNSLDYRKENLLIIRRGTSRYKGVHKIKKTGKWNASIYVDNQHIFLGNYSTEELAAKAYRCAAGKLFRGCPCIS